MMKVDLSKRIQVKINDEWRELISINRHMPFQPCITYSSDEKHDMFRSGYSSGRSLDKSLEFREMPKSAKGPTRNPVVQVRTS